MKLQGAFIASKKISNVTGAYNIKKMTTHLEIIKAQFPQGDNFPTIFSEKLRSSVIKFTLKNKMSTFKPFRNHFRLRRG